MIEAASKCLVIEIIRFNCHRIQKKHKFLRSSPPLGDRGFPLEDRGCFDLSLRYAVRRHHKRQNKK
jgi:hypothetical protein